MWSLLRSWCLQWWCWLLRRVCNGMRFEWVILKRKINFKPRLNFQVLVRFSSTSPVDLQRCGSVLRKRGPFQMLVRSWVCYCKHWHYGLETMVWRKDPSRKKTLQGQPIGSINTGRVWVLGYTIKICEGVCELKATVFFLHSGKPYMIVECSYSIVFLPSEASPINHFEERTFCSLYLWPSMFILRERFQR